MVSHFNVDYLVDCFSKESVLKMIVRSLGKDCLLLSFEDDETFKEMEQSNSKWVLKYFKRVVKYSDEIMFGTRYAWLKCFGIPTKA